MSLAAYLDILKAILGSVVLQALYDVWGDSCQRIQIILVKMMKVGVIMPPDVAGFVFKRLKEVSLYSLIYSESRASALPLKSIDLTLKTQLTS
jgi:hypothetical protein